MRSLFLLLISAFLVVNAGVAQDKEAKKALRKANSSLNSFNLDQNNNAELAEAYANIQLAEKDEVLAAESETWKLKGDIFSAIGSKVLQAKDPTMAQLANTEGVPEVEMPYLKAFDAYQKAFSMAEKGRDQRNALDALAGIQNSLVSFGALLYDPSEGDYVNAYKHFNATLEAHKLLKDNGEASALDEPADRYSQQMFYTALAAVQGKRTEDAKRLIDELIEMNYEDPLIYELMYSIVSEDGDQEEAYKYLQIGRERYPDTTSLLFAEINHFLRLGKLDVLITRLEEGIEAEPDNPSLYATMGSVYDQLYQKALEAGEEDAQKYFDKALEYYDKALELDADNVNATYSIGALYYNKAALMSKDLAELEGDYSKEGTAKYEALQDKIFTEFDKALPYFQKAESLDPNDRNTLIALKEIYAKKNDIDMSNEFKERLDKLEAGETNESSYFNK